MIDDHIEEFRQRTTPPWDHLRERRVLREVERRLGTRRALHRSRRRALLVAVPLSLGVAALVVAYFAGVDLGQKRAVGGPSAAPQVVVGSGAPAPGPPEGPVEPTHVRVLADGSRLELSRAARVEVRSESGTRVELAQDEGRVRYQVPPVPGRAFVVFARGVLVQVKGTVFVVEVDSGKVSVRVEQGLVRVAASSGQVELGVGDELSTPADQGTTSDTAMKAPSPPASEAAPPPRSSRSERSDSVSALPAGALLDRADVERRSGDLAAASGTLRELLARYPGDRRAALAWFTLGKVERARDRAAVGANAFQRSFALAPEGPLSEDALAEEAIAWAAANDAPAARAAAELYAKRFPNGTHAARLQHLRE